MENLNIILSTDADAIRYIHIAQSFEERLLFSKGTCFAIRSGYLDVKDKYYIIVVPQTPHPSRGRNFNGTPVIAFFEADEEDYWKKLLKVLDNDNILLFYLTTAYDKNVRILYPSGIN